MLDLTLRQQETLLAIEEYINKYNYAPAVRDIGEKLIINSTSTVSWLLNKLREKGYVDWKEGQPRTLHIIKTAS